jgi:hypothetical protein
MQPVPRGLIWGEQAPGSSLGAVGGSGRAEIFTGSGFGAGGFARTSGSFAAENDGGCDKAAALPNKADKPVTAARTGESGTGFMDAPCLLAIRSAGLKHPLRRQSMRYNVAERHEKDAAGLKRCPAPWESDDEEEAQQVFG